MIRITQHLISPLAICFCVLVASCDSSENASKAYQDAPKASATVSTSSTNAQPLSVEARSCLELVKSSKYAEAIEPCQSAIQDSSSPEVTRAYDKAKAEVQKLAESAATNAASDALGGLGGN